MKRQTHEHTEKLGSSGLNPLMEKPQDLGGSVCLFTTTEQRRVLLHTSESMMHRWIKAAGFSNLSRAVSVGEQSPDITISG